MLKPQSPRSPKGEFFAVARTPLLTAVLFFCVTGFGLLLSSETLYEFSRETRLSAFQGLGEQLRFAIERGLRFGRPLDGYAGLTEQLENASLLADGAVGVRVTDVRGNTLYSAGFTDVLAGRETLPENLGDILAGDEAGDAWLETANSHILLMPIKGRERTLAGSLVLAVDAESTKQDYRRFIRRSILLILGLAGAILLIQSGWAVRFADTGNDKNGRRRLYLLFLIFVGGGQLAFSIPSAFFFRDALTASETAKVTMTGRTLSQDLERLINKGLHLEQIGGIAAHFAEIRTNTPEIAAIRLTEGGRLVAESGAAVAGGELVEMPVNSYWPDRHTPSKPVAKLEIRTDPGAVNAALNRIYLNQFTVLIISLLLLMELSRLLVTVRAGAAQPQPLAAADAEADADDYVPLIRILAFLFFFGYDMVLSFVPLTARSLPGTIWLLGETQRAALPVTMEAVAAGLGTLLAARISRSVDTRRALALGVGVAIAGMACACAAGHIGVFILARGVAGLGFGLVFMLCQLALMARHTKADGLAQMFSGLFAGSICGVATGAMASELVGYQNVFALSIAFFLMALPFALRIPPPPREVGAGGGEKNGTRERKTRSFLKTAGFFLSGEFVLPVALATLPIAVSLAGFINFGMPVSLNSQGVPQSDIGRLFMLYGLCFILFGPLCAKLADRTGKYLAWVCVAGIANGCALLCAWAYPHLGGFALAALLAGLANCLLASSAMVYILCGRRAQHQVRETVGSVYRMVERCGHMAGPLLFSLLFAGSGSESWLFRLGAAFCCAAVVLYCVRRAAKGNL